MLHKNNLISPVGLDRLMGQMLEDITQGLDTVESLFQNKKAYTNYPPSNILQKVSENKEEYFEIQLAVAGWNEEDFDILVENEDTLKIKGEKKEKLEQSEETIVIHSTIAERQFEKEYVFSKKIKEVNLTLEKGILTVIVYVKEPNENVKKIKFGK